MLSLNVPSTEPCKKASTKGPMDPDRRRLCGHVSLEEDEGLDQKMISTV